MVNWDWSWWGFRVWGWDVVEVGVLGERERGSYLCILSGCDYVR